MSGPDSSRRTVTRASEMGTSGPAEVCKTLPAMEAAGWQPATRPRASTPRKRLDDRTDMGPPYLGSWGGRSALGLAVLGHDSVPKVESPARTPIPRRQAASRLARHSWRSLASAARVDSGRGSSHASARAASGRAARRAAAPRQAAATSRPRSTGVMCAYSRASSRTSSMGSSSVHGLADTTKASTSERDSRRPRARPEGRRELPVRPQQEAAPPNAAADRVRPVRLDVARCGHDDRP